MPPKKQRGSQTSDTKESCCICCQAIATGKDEALFFGAGKCQQWLQLYCASVSVKCYKAIIDSQEERINALTCTVDAMKLEIAQLKEALSTAQAAAATSHCGHKIDNSDKSSCGWQLVEKKGRGKGRSGRTDHRHPQHTEPEKTKQRWHSVKTLAVNHPKQRKARDSYQNGPNTPPGGRGATALSENREVVDGVRRVWGTMRGCSYRTELSTLQRLITVAEKVDVSGKFKKRGSTEVRWWFLIRGELRVGPANS